MCCKLILYECKLSVMQEVAWPLCSEAKCKDVQVWVLDDGVTSDFHAGDLGLLLVISQQLNFPSPDIGPFVAMCSVNYDYSLSLSLTK